MPDWLNTAAIITPVGSSCRAAKFIAAPPPIEKPTAYTRAESIAKRALIQSRAAWVWIRLRSSEKCVCPPLSGATQNQLRRRASAKNEVLSRPS